MFHVLANPSAKSIHSSRRCCLIALYSWHGTNPRHASTRQATNLDADPETPLPRFLRRQVLRKGGKDILPSELASKQKAADHLSPKNFRSRHYDPNSEATPRSQIRLLEPHVLSARLKKLSDNGKIGEAIVMLKNAPLDAQNTQVWNTMIWETLKAKRYSLAYQLYIDVCPVLLHSLLVSLTVLL
jgi:hypothetical protein